MPLRVRLALVVAIAVAILLAAGGWLFVRQLQGGLDDALDANLRARADALTQQVGPDGDTGFQDPGATGLLAPNEALAQVVNGNGTLLDSSEGAKDKSLLGPAQLTQARRGAVGITTTDAQGSIRLLALPVPDSGRPPTVVVVGTTRELTVQAVTRARTALAIWAPVSVLLSALGAWLLAGAALRPVERMRRQAEAITSGDPRARLSVPATRDEVARLGATLNALLERLHHALSRQRNFVADAGHDRIRQVLDNLLDNALRFAPPGSTVSVRVASAGSPERVVLDVSDQGPGFPVDFLPHAFERFRRADASRSPQQGGTGLGLAIVASLVQAHGGTVTADNLPRRGARVRVELPTGVSPNHGSAHGSTPPGLLV